MANSFTASTQSGPRDSILNYGCDFAAGKKKGCWYNIKKEEEDEMNGRKKEEEKKSGGQLTTFLYYPQQS